MTLHAEAGRWQQAATAARAAIAVSGGLAGLGGDALRDAHEKISARAEVILEMSETRARTRSIRWLAQSAVRDVIAEFVLNSAPYMPSWSTKRLRERSTSASAEARSDQCEPSTDLPGSRSL